MAINYLRLFTRLGKLVGALNESRTQAATVRARQTSLEAEYTTVHANVLADLEGFTDQEAQAGLAWNAFMGDLASETLIREVETDRGWESITLSVAFEDLCRQMTVDSESLDESPSTVGVTNVTLGLIDTKLRFEFVTSTLDRFGEAHDLIVPDTIKAFSANVGDDLELYGLDDPDDAGYPNPPGITQQILTVYSDDTDSAGADPGLELWGSVSALSQWTNTGTLARGTTVSTDAYGTYHAILTDTGATATIQQDVFLAENTMYVMSFRVKNNTIAGPAGTVQVDLINKSTGSVYKAGGTASTAAFADVTRIALGAFVGEDLPDEVALRLTFTAGTSDDIINVYNININDMPELYIDGPRIVGIGRVPISEWTISITNNDANVHTSLVRGMQRLLDLSQFEQRIPTSGTPTRTNALVV